VIDLYFPTSTYRGKKVNTVGIWLSGGADSSLLCFLVAKYIKDNNLDVKILPLTVQKYPNEYVDTHKRIIEILDCKEIFLDQILYTIDDWHIDYQSTFHFKNMENVKKGLYNFIYTGLTKTPILDPMEKEYWVDFPELENVRSEEVKKFTLISAVFVENNIEYEFGEIRPLFHFDKKHVAKLYKEYDLLETLFSHTTSCVDPNRANIGHCGNCWFCQERLWAFGRLE
jgi:tRNA(Ile)-lysidine synthase TilS/MesJ